MKPIPRKAIDDAFALLPPKMDSAAARVLVLAVALQESGFTARRQYGNGPARGYWQFEAGGGVIGVLAHHSTATHARIVCGLRVHRGQRAVGRLGQPGQALGPGQ